MREMVATQFGPGLEKDGTRIRQEFSTLVGDGVNQLKDEYDQFTGAVKNTASEHSDIKNILIWGKKNQMNFKRSKKMGHKENSKRKPKHIKTALNTNASGTVSSILKAAEKGPAILHDTDKEAKKNSTDWKKGSK